jgi:hypothetical protein
MLVGCSFPRHGALLLLALTPNRARDQYFRDRFGGTSIYLHNTAGESRIMRDQPHCLEETTMSLINHKNILSPFALSLLITASGCALDTSSEPIESTSEQTTAVFVLVDDSVATSPGELSVVNHHLVVRQGATTKVIPPSQKPETDPFNGEAAEGSQGGLAEEGTANEEGGSEEGGSATGTANGSDDVAPDGTKTGSAPAISELGQLSDAQLGGLVDAIVFATPARMDETLDDASFVDFDFAGATTTSSQRLDGCRFHRVESKTNRLRIVFDCRDLGVTAPSGFISCQANFATAGAVNLSCEAQLESDNGAVAGNIQVTYEFAADLAQIDASFRTTPETTVVGSYSIEVVSGTASANLCQRQHGRVTVSTADRTRSGQLTAVDRCQNSCLPYLGNIVYSMFDDATNEGSVIVLTGITTGNWIATDGTSAALNLSLCQ